MGKPKSLKIKTGLIQTTYFDNQKDAAEFLGIKNSSRKAIEARCKDTRYTPEWD
ncbi:MAG: hypothetical protein WD512_13790 [Candidatus Paceibacterota bacterium]